MAPKRRDQPQEARYKYDRLNPSPVAERHRALVHKGQRRRQIHQVFPGEAYRVIYKWISWRVNDWDRQRCVSFGAMQLLRRCITGGNDRLVLRSDGHRRRAH